MDVHINNTCDISAKKYFIETRLRDIKLNQMKQLNQINQPKKLIANPGKESTINFESLSTEDQITSKKEITQYYET